MVYEISPEQRLANAIVVQAAKEYAGILYESKRNPEDKGLFYKKKSIERFFRSEWYRLLTDADADYLLNGIENMVDRRIRKDGNVSLH